MLLCPVPRVVANAYRRQRRARASRVTMDFARAIQKKPLDEVSLIPYDDFCSNPETSSVNHRGTNTNLPTAAPTTEHLFQDTDFMDSAFVDFHRDFARYMYDTYGLLARSRAFDLHEAIFRAVHIAPDPSDDKSERA